MKNLAKKSARALFPRHYWTPEFYWALYLVLISGLLSLFSPYFDKLFNDENYNESKQDEIELNVEGLANPKVFEDFLLAFCPPGQIEVLPNTQNVGDLLVLADYFQVDLLKKKCERHLELAREMDIVKRVLLTKKFGLKKLQAKLLKGCTPEESQRICSALLNAPEQYTIKRKIPKIV